ncbi:MAG TPA: YetF domain-containing protein [Azospirillum sp.]|nr:YetF domain-containing protein [Azospirillum sp.]
MFFDAWSGVARVLIVGTLAYAALILLLRVSGKRTLTKLNAFDLVVTVALGSTLATVLLSKSVPLAEGVTALALLVALQYVITWLSVRSPRFQAMIKDEPTLIVRHGRFLESALKAQRMTREEVLAAMRASGVPDIETVAAVVLETDGSVSILTDAGGGRAEALSNVARWAARRDEGAP